MCLKDHFALKFNKKMPRRFFFSFLKKKKASTLRHCIALLKFTMIIINPQNLDVTCGCGSDFG